MKAAIHLHPAYRKLLNPPQRVLLINRESLLDTPYWQAMPHCKLVSSIFVSIRHWVCASRLSSHNSPVLQSASASPLEAFLSMICHQTWKSQAASCSSCGDFQSLDLAANEPCSGYCVANFTVAWEGHMGCEYCGRRKYRLGDPYFLQGSAGWRLSHYLCQHAEDKTIALYIYIFFSITCFPNCTSALKFQHLLTASILSTCKK